LQIEKFMIMSRQLFWVVMVFVVFTNLNGFGQVLQEKSGDYTEAILFPLQQEHVHSPSIVELPNGDLLAAWFQGSGERWADDVRIMGARLKDGSDRWTEPFLMADVAGFPDVNPVLFVDQKERLWLMWYAVLANQWESSLLKYRISESFGGDAEPEWQWQDNLLLKPGGNTERGIQPNDRFVAAVGEQTKAYENYFRDTLLTQLSAEKAAELEKAWVGYKHKLDSLAKGQNMVRGGRIRSVDGETPAELGYPLSRRIGWQTKNKPFLSGDRIIVPLYSDGLDCAIFAYTDDFGQNWQSSNPVVGGIGIQPAIVEKEDGTLLAFMRDNGPEPQRLQYTTSSDRGETWSIPRDTDLLNPGSGADAVTLQNGDWLLVWNDTEDGRHSLALGISHDEGQSWKIRHLERDMRGEQATRSHYPSIIEGRDGSIHVIYSYHRNDQSEDAKTIKYVRLAQQWLESKVPGK
jgi:predicted neuraminidase